MFDTEKFIVEVEKRPALYDQSLKDYANRDKKTNLWNEIGSELYENWDELSTEERNKLGRDLKTKWRSIRDHFKKEVALETKIKSGQAAKSKKKYIFYDQLLFLRTYGTNRPTSSNFKETQNLDENADHENSGSAEQKADLEPKTPRGPLKRKLLSESLEIRDIANMLSKSVALQKQARTEDRTGNKAFLMSLLPLIDNMPQNQSFAVRCKIMEILQTFNFTQSTPSYAALNQLHTSYASSCCKNFWEAPKQSTYNYSQPHTSQQSLYDTQRPTSVIPTPTSSPGEYLASPSTNSEETQMSEASSI